MSLYQHNIAVSVSGRFWCHFICLSIISSIFYPFLSYTFVQLLTLPPPQHQCGCNYKAALSDDTHRAEGQCGASASPQGTDPQSTYTPESEASSPRVKRTTDPRSVRHRKPLVTSPCAIHQNAPTEPSASPKEGL